MQKLLLTETETGQVTGLSRSTLRKLWAQGDLQPVHIGRSIRFVAADVEAFITRLRERAQVEVGI
jgi:excisionase family DNA binding protein